jgi:hypothetical protein
MFRGPGGVKFGASRVCPKCNRAVACTQSALAAAAQALCDEKRRECDPRGGEFRRRPIMSAFEEHKDELEHYEQMFGRDRGRLAVSLDRITNALVLVGQHGVYCTSQRNPTLPAMDLRMINQELVHAKELVQSVMEELKRARQQADK